MTDLTFETQRRTSTQYVLTESWAREFRHWFQGNVETRQWSRIVVVTDRQVWDLYQSAVEDVLKVGERPVVPIVRPAGEASKEVADMPDLVRRLTAEHVHRRDLLINVGGGVCCDLGGFLAAVYMRGIDYVNVPTSLMAQVDGAIGGKVGVNAGVRKNLAGEFHHPLAVLIDPAFLDTLPDNQLRWALSEAVKLAVIREDPVLWDLLCNQTEDLLRRDRPSILLLLERCLRGKLALLAADPYEQKLDRVLNLGHAMAHSLERLQVMPEGRCPSHGEAVSLGLAATARYAFHAGLCSAACATRVLETLAHLGLPLCPACTADCLADNLASIREHRGGQLWLVVPVDGGGVRIVPEADLHTLEQCLYPVQGLPL